MPIDYTKRSPAAAPAPPPAAAAPAPTAPPTAPAAVSLTKASPSVSLTKRGQSSGQLRVNLNWNARPAAAPSGGGFLSRLAGGGAQPSIDLDLGCLYELTDGSKSVVQALGNMFRNGEPGAPVVWLDGDDRSGSSSGGENLFVDLGQLSRIKRILVFAFIYEGVANWAAADAVVTLLPASGAPVEVRLDESRQGANLCAIALLENRGGELVVGREVQFFSNQSALDAAYGWGMKWKAGRK